MDNFVVRVSSIFCGSLRVGRSELIPKLASSLECSLRIWKLGFKLVENYDVEI